ncbi:aminodeoxychorismate/anthranilate synthase component II [Halobellus sp. Atlit-38R]|uniref:anthranilate synthase component II n=1 Tax=Halobellus sp. Atlit-38R TaxID=2282131 RepID=UPI000EF26FF5|nr:aminodeoxychorismate/anthranilate synthase component II [Halobellus sp. Atlit-38R]RLM88156.1 aminodeoxychorismate/anthranilate synthase component II [Halobellus sp. Atlit-38R]
MTLRLLVVDNFDSFTYNLVEYFSEQRVDGEPVDVIVRKNTADIDELRELDPDAIVISPGPGHPKNERDVGVTTEVLTSLSQTIPTLGVCLGLEAAVHAYGGEIGHAPEPIHGKAYPVDHDGRGVFAGLAQGFQAGRYHSLVATTVPEEFEVSATTAHEITDGDTGDNADNDTDDDADGDAAAETTTTDLVMGVRHREYPIEAVQFHPESVLTGVGHDVVRNFLDECVFPRQADEAPTV